MGDREERVGKQSLVAYVRCLAVETKQRQKQCPLKDQTYVPPRKNDTIDNGSQICKTQNTYDVTAISRNF